MAKKLHMVGNAHIDPVWLWRWQEGFQEIKATFRSALDRLSESHDLVFTASSACFYAWIEENDPEMFAEIRARVAEGRWSVVGGWWIEPDCNLPCGESFARQGLYGQRYFMSAFGAAARVGYNPDAFGHAATLPQILRKSGLDGYCFLRPNHQEKDLPARLFAWEGADGSRITSFRIPFEYCAPRDDIEPHIRRCAEELAASPVDLMCFYGVGNHGGGPTIRNIEQIRRLDQSGELPALCFSTPDRYFAEVRDRGDALPVVRGELQYHARGCFSVHAGVKAWNRRAESMLMAAERLTEVARRVAGANPVEDLTRAWKGILFNQFHDILAGTSLESAYTDARDLYGEAMAIAARATNHAIQSIAWRIDLPPGGRPIVVFNPHAWPSTTPVELEYGGLQEGEALVDDQGQPVPMQTIRSEATVKSGRTRLCFVASLPPLGWRTYRVVADGAAATVDPDAAVSAGELTLENRHLRLELHPRTGCPKSLLLKRNGCELLASAGRAAVYEDRSDTWGHGVARWNREIGSFEVTRARVVENGPVVAVLRVESAYGDSRLVQEFALHVDLDRIEVRATVDWREKHTLFKLRFPTAIDRVTATTEAPYGFVDRQTRGDEEPCLSWIDLSGLVGAARAGLSLLTDSKYSVDISAADIGLTVLRSPIYAHHDPLVPEEDGIYRYIDQGPHDFSYALVPHTATWRESGIVKRAAELNQRPIPLIESFHSGPLAPSGSAVAVDAEAVAVTVLKRAEDGDDLIIRAVETLGVDSAASIQLPAWGRTIETRFGPLEIKTFRVPRDPSRPAREVDLLEL